MSLLFSSCLELNECRNDYHNINSEIKLEAFLKKYEKSDCKTLTPYLASATMMKAEYVLNPLKKLSYFNKGKNTLEAFIKKNPSSVDARYVRIMTQNNIPKFLNYSSEMKNDIKFVKANISKSDIPQEMINTILKNINNLKH
jgi:hypothetical protein